MALPTCKLVIAAYSAALCAARELRKARLWPSKPPEGQQGLQVASQALDRAFHWSQAEKCHGGAHSSSCTRKCQNAIQHVLSTWYLQQLDAPHEKSDFGSDAS
eukprot:TRINITY_DN39426_c0_g1_i2.p2 TRINITY_DN39426_c0_g1~~TRINITY_DN39426_c0_g1_i2.p2  ORF type:complete len:103 (+),score=12.95 TRINITY_DN39426_c0_g1_i2:120-428(+)